MRKSLLLCLILSCLAPAAYAAPAKGSAGKAPAGMGPAVFCNGTYALCIKALCNAPSGTGAGQKVDCVCDVVNGWSMGPGSCDTRSKSLVSTYSNLYNESNKTLFCENKDTVWAWCYGAPCKADPNDPKKAICSCPVKTSPMKTLGGNCEPASCSKVWSAANPVADAFANDHFYKVGKEKGYSPNPPAAQCSNAIAKPGAGGER
jgi:hypothetical protein